MMHEKAGKKLREIRNKNHLTQKELAEIFEMSTNYISTVETGVQKGSIDLYLKAANYFNVSFDYFFIDSLNSKKNMYIDTVALRMSYMDEAEQELVLEIVEDILKYKKKDK